MAENRDCNGRRVLNITFDNIRDKNIEQVRILNNVIFPVNYQESFYRDCLACSDINLLALHNDISIGAIGSRLEKQTDGKAKLYIMTLGVLAPYRGRGVGEFFPRGIWKSICHFVNQESFLVQYGYSSRNPRLFLGSQLLEKVLLFCRQDSNIVEAYLHVQEGNDEVVQFYEKFGFVVTGKEEDYYRRLDPSCALVLSKGLVSGQTDTPVQ